MMLLEKGGVTMLLEESGGITTLLELGGGVTLLEDGGVTLLLEEIGDGSLSTGTWPLKLSWPLRVRARISMPSLV